MFTKNLDKEIVYKASLSGGAGGQNVNKVSTKIEISFHVFGSMLLNDFEKNKIVEKLSAKINDEGFLKVVCQTERTQLGNKEKARIKFYKMLTIAFKEKKIRKATKPSKSSVQARITTKKVTSEKKVNRKKVNIE